jgi:predicted site-specific integrase-resolvase
MKDFLNTKQTMSILKISRATLFKYIKKGILYPEKNDKGLLFKRKEILKIKKLLKKFGKTRYPGRSFSEKIKEVICQI